MATDVPPVTPNRSRAPTHTIEVPVTGMDCAECARHVTAAIAGVSGVREVTVLLAAEKAVITLDAQRTDTVDLTGIRAAVERAGYRVPEPAPTPTTPDLDSAPPVSAGPDPRRFTRAVLTVSGIVFAVVLVVAVLGEGLRLTDRLTGWVPFPVGVLFVAAFGYPVFRNVVRATLRRQVIAHTLMSVGVGAALAVGQWETAAIVVLFMRVGDYAERFTTERSRGAVRDLLALAPRTARVERDGAEVSVPIAEVRLGETVVVRPGERIPVDGEVGVGAATVDQAAITGESIPVDVAAGDRVHAATIARLGSLRVRVDRVGAETTFGRVIAMVEHAEADRADVQRLADRFAAWFLPVVGTIAALTFLLSRDPLATAAVLVVACSCSLALATPVAMLATIGAAARRGLIVKGGRHIETLARADVVLIDKTGTLTLGQPRVTSIVGLGGWTEHDILALAASVERDSEHPLAGAIRDEARERDVALPGLVEAFVSVPGEGVRGRVDGATVTVGNRRLAAPGDEPPELAALEDAGQTAVLVHRDGVTVGIIAIADTVRPDAAAAIARLRRAGIGEIAMLTGDNPRVAAAIAGPLGIGFRADLLPEDKVAAVRAEQARGRRVVMVGDGVNDAPALARADVGIAMGVRGTDIAIEAAHVVLMRDDWGLVPDAILTARRTMGVVRINLGFTALYNVVGLTLAAFGILPPVLAAAAQSLPDLGILANSTRLLRPARDQDDSPPASR